MKTIPTRTKKRGNDFFTLTPNPSLHPDSYRGKRGDFLQQLSSVLSMHPPLYGTLIFRDAGCFKEKFIYLYVLLTKRTFKVR